MQVRIVRSGAVVRVEGNTLDTDPPALALVFCDLAFADGHMERWLGPGSVCRIGPDDLRPWALEVAEMFLDDLRADVAIARHDLQNGPPAPSEVFVEWNAEVPVLGE